MTEKCKWCQESERDRIEMIEIVVHRENPKAYGYPEVCNWKERYATNI